MSIARRVSTVLLALLGAVSAIVPSASVQADPLDDPGTIAYVRRSPHQIRLIQPDGSDDRVFWTSPTPDTVVGILDLAWRPDGSELAFSSDHERTCSWFETDVYAIGHNGRGLRRVTNAPACAGLAAYPQGKVTVDVATLSQSGHFAVYVQGSTELKGITLGPGGFGQVTFDHVADFGPGIVQPAVGIYGLYRYPGDTAPDIKAGQSVAGPAIWLSTDNEYNAHGTGNVTWRGDGTRIGYAMRNCAAARQIEPYPPVASQGTDLPTAPDRWPCLVDLAPTASKANQFLYTVDWNSWFDDDLEGIYLASTAESSGGTRLVSPALINTEFGFYDTATVHDVQWLPDGSGFMFIMTYIYVNTEDPDPVCMGTCADLFAYDFATGAVTQVTRLGDDSARALSISPDGQQVAFERLTEDPSHPLESSSAIWVMQRSGAGLRLLVDDAASPAWGVTPPPLIEVHLPMVMR